MPGQHQKKYPDNTRCSKDEKRKAKDKASKRDRAKQKSPNVSTLLVFWSFFMNKHCKKSRVFCIWLSEASWHPRKQRCQREFDLTVHTKIKCVTVCLCVCPLQQSLPNFAPLTYYDFEISILFKRTILGITSTGVT